MPITKELLVELRSYRAYLPLSELPLLLYQREDITAEELHAIGVVYHKGKFSSGFRKNLVLAHMYYQLALQKGYQLAQSSINDIFNGVDINQMDVKSFIIGLLTGDTIHTLSDKLLTAIEPYAPAEIEPYNSKVTVFSNIGANLCEGVLGIIPDFFEARRWFEAIQESCGFACVNLGRLYQQGNGVACDYVIAIRYYRKAIAKGYEDLVKSYMTEIFESEITGEQFNAIGEIYFHDAAIEEAKQWFDKACNKGCGAANGHIGAIYEHGYEAFSRDYFLATKHYQLAVDRGHMEALRDLKRLMGASVLNGEILYKIGMRRSMGDDGVKKDYAEGWQWLEAASRKHYDLAYIELGIYCENGYCGQSNYLEAFKYYQRAIDLGVQEAQSKIQQLRDNPHLSDETRNAIASLYDAGQNGIIQDYTQARLWFMVSAERGCVVALRKLGEFSQYGWGIERDLIKAAKYYIQALRRGFQDVINDIAQLSLTEEQWLLIAENYYYGDEGEIEDVELAYLCYQQVIQLAPNHQRAHGVMGHMYEHAESVIGDLYRAKNHYERARRCSDVIRIEEYLLAQALGERNYTIRQRHRLSAASWITLGNEYRQGNGTSQNLMLARLCYQRAINKNKQYEYAHYMYAELLLQEDIMTIEKLLEARESYKYISRLDKVNFTEEKIIEKLLQDRGYLVEQQQQFTMTQWKDFGIEYQQIARDDASDNNQKQLNFILARKCFEHAISLNQACVEAQKGLGEMFEHGDGVEVNLLKSSSHYQAGGYGLKIHFKRIERRMLQEAIDSGQSLNNTDGQGRTALHRAAQNKCFKLYASLLCLGFNTRIKDHTEKYAHDYLDRTEQDRVNRLRSIFSTHLHKLKQSIGDILYPTMRLINGEMLAETSTKQALEHLYGIAEIKPLLELARLAAMGRHRLSYSRAVHADPYDSDEEVSCSSSYGGTLSIHIDQVNPNGTVENLNCRAPNVPHGAVGRYSSQNDIFLAGRRENGQLVLGTLIHELCHFIANEVFNNRCLPYASNDTQSKEEFTQITAEMNLRRDSLGIIFKCVFNPGGYTESQRHNELIVRVPQMIVLQGVEQVQREAPALLDYYNNKFLPSVISHTQSLTDKIMGRGCKGWSPRLFQSIETTDVFEVVLSAKRSAPSSSSDSTLRPEPPTVLRQRIS